MILPQPKRGDVIRYAYLWAREHRQGRDEGRKERPAVVLAFSVQERDGTVRVLCLAITHAPPVAPADAVPLPAEVKLRLGLDNDPAWIVTTEANAFTWPGPDLRPIPGRKPATVLYGRIPGNLLRTVAQSFLANRQRQRGEMTSRTS